MAFFLTELERQAWLARVDRNSPVLLAFAGWLDDLCETALEQAGRELPVEHAATILLRDAAEAGEVGEERLAA
ncbi:MAG TPA: hypothetical protein VJ838_04735 [Gaiellaceae bacterium]|nr:hypothetical protein [Gaiellaceae bacterium]